MLRKFLLLLNWSLDRSRLRLTRVHYLYHVNNFVRKKCFLLLCFEQVLKETIGNGLRKGNTQSICFRSSHQSCSIKKAVLKNFAIFTGKHLCWSLFLVRPATLLKRDYNLGVFLWILWNFKEHPFWKTLRKAASAAGRSKNLLRIL